MAAVGYQLAKWREVLAFVAIIVLAAGISQTGLGHNMLQKAGLFEKPASYTSLAFLHPQYLPEVLGSKQETIDASFVIHNTGNVPVNYQWSISLVRNRRTRSLGVGNIRVAAEQDAEVVRLAKISCVQGEIKLVVRIAHPAENIDATTACWSPPKK